MVIKISKIEVILVDKNDKQIGVEEKLSAHKAGKLHRAFSIFVFNKNNELLLHKRASTKYHSGSLWTNTCCSHPRVGEELELAIHRRLEEEMGFDTPLEKTFNFIYKATVGDLTEHEFDHVFIGKYDGEVKPDPEEVEDIAWFTYSKLIDDMKIHPEKYTEWFKILMHDHGDKVKNFWPR
jgi:isopentenyl-diphosphate delta-isomerase